jgi:hypothetical protein
MQVVWTLHMYIAMWLTCKNIRIYEGIFEYFFEMTAP